MKRRVGRISVAIALMICSLVMTAVLRGSAAANEDGAGTLRLLTAAGESEVRVRPDLGEVRLGVETEAPTAQQARDDNAARLGRVADALKALGIPDRDVETALFQIYPIRRFEDERQRGEPPIVGYRVSNIVTVRTERLDTVARIIDDSAKAGANRVDAVEFTLRDEVAPRRTALKQAVAHAKANAAAMARELGVQLVRVQSVQQGGVGVVRPPMFGRAAGIEAAAPTPVFPGQVTVRASVTLSYVIR